MTAEPLRRIGYKCPECSGTVSRDTSVFTIMNESEGLGCSCGHPGVKIDYSKGKFKVEAQCMFCGGVHSKQFSAGEIYSSPLLSVDCTAAGFGICFIGSAGEVTAALESVEEFIDSVLSGYNIDECFYNNDVLFDILASLYLLADGKNISCSCGGDKWELKLHYDRAELVCKSCHASEIVPARETADADRMRARKKIKLNKAIL